jgi:hypothetical protein
MLQVPRPPLTARQLLEPATQAPSNTPGPLFLTTSWQSAASLRAAGPAPSAANLSAVPCAARCQLRLAPPLPSHPCRPPRASPAVEAASMPAIASAHPRPQRERPVAIIASSSDETGVLAEHAERPSRLCAGTQPQPTGGPTPSPAPRVAAPSAPSSAKRPPAAAAPEDAVRGTKKRPRRRKKLHDAPHSRTRTELGDWMYLVLGMRCSAQAGLTEPQTGTMEEEHRAGAAGVLPEAWHQGAPLPFGCRKWASELRRSPARARKRTFSLRSSSTGGQAKGKTDLRMRMQVPPPPPKKNESSFSRRLRVL